MQARNTDFPEGARKHVEFGLRLQGVLHQRGVMQKDLAEALGMSSSRVSNWCQGLNLPSGIYRLRLAEYLGVDPEWLIEGKIPAESRNQGIQTRNAVLREPQVTIPSRPIEGADEIRAYMEPWIRGALNDKNIGPYVMAQLRKHLPHDDLGLFVMQDGRK